MADLIYGRTSEEIKQGLKMHAQGERCVEDGAYCPYYALCKKRFPPVMRDALALIERLEAELERLGEFGKLFKEYTGCPRGATGRAALPIEEEVLAMKPIRDVDNGEWIPVNADALRELVAKYKQLRDAVPKWISVKKGLPVKHLRVLVMNGHGMVTSGHLTYRKSKDGAPLWDMEGIKRNDVTHWAPMPEYLKGCGGI